MSAPRTRNTFRTHLILTCGISTLAFGALIGASVFVPLAVQLDRRDLDPNLMAGIAQHFLDLHRAFWPVVLGALIASILSGMLLFQRMTGPLQRFVQVFESVARGEIPAPMTIRRMDYLSTEAAALNRMLEALREARGARESDRES
jgi:methyl-accepting chemotaxis protein